MRHVIVKVGAPNRSGPRHRPRAAALDAVRKALKLDSSHQIADLRKRHGLGADAMDDFHQFYVIKMESSGDFPKEVTLQGSQLDAAQGNEDFFLLVVAGLLDDSSELRVRFIFKPLDRLALRIKGEDNVLHISENEGYRAGHGCWPTI